MEGFEMKYGFLSERTKKEELKVSVETKKAFAKYLKNVIYLDYEKDIYDVKSMMECWLASFADSDEFKEIQKQVDDKMAEEKRIKEEEKAKREAVRKAKIEEKIAKLNEQLEGLEE